MSEGLKREYEFWLQNVKEEELLEELKSVAESPKEIEDRFYKALAFGTGGLRGIIGAGTNRMNVYTVGKATFGLAEYLLETGGTSIAIAYTTKMDLIRLFRSIINRLSFVRSWDRNSMKCQHNHKMGNSKSKMLSVWVNHNRDKNSMLCWNNHRNSSNVSGQRLQASVLRTQGRI